MTNEEQTNLLEKIARRSLPPCVRAHRWEVNKVPCVCVNIAINGFVIEGASWNLFNEVAWVKLLPQLLIDATSVELSRRKEQAFPRIAEYWVVSAPIQRFILRDIRLIVDPPIPQKAVPHR